MSRRKRYAVVEEQGIRFVFAYDDSAPEMLHIWARHLTRPGDAIATWFNGQTHWNPHYRRFETATDTHVVYWFWLEETKAIMIVTCYRLEG